jgi:hypothetical protein
LGNKEFAIEYSCVLEDSRFSFKIFDTFNISENNVISVEAPKVVVGPW